jgi:signal transduction histidine kinase
MTEGLVILVAVAAAVVGALVMVLRRRQADLDTAGRLLERKEALAQLGAMMAGIAHELGTPLGAVCCSLDTRRRALARVRAELATLAAEPEAAEAALARIGKALDALEGTDPVLDVALERTSGIVHHMRMAGRGQQPAGERVDLNRVVEGAALLLRNALKQCAELVVEAGEDAVVVGNNAGLGSIVINLLSNACQALGEQGRITVTTRRRGDRVLLAVADTGPGVPAVDHERIFRMGTTSKDADSGTGMGLFISRKIAANHGGTLTVANGPDGGAVFTLDLPAAPATAVAG